MGAIAKDKAPALALSLTPMNGFAAENLAAASIKESIVKNMGQFPGRVTPATIQVARRAFFAEPVAPEAVAILALGRGENSKQSLMNIAFALSRRQSLATGWLIDDSGTRNDISSLLNHYDTILRTSITATSIIIPVLARALANNDFIEPMTNLLRKQPPWANQFWGTVVGTPASLDNAVRLRQAVYKPSDSDGEYRDAELIHALIDNQQFEQALSLYHLLNSNKKTGLLLKNGSFDTQSSYPPLDWQLVSTGEYGATINDGKLELRAIRNSGGLFVRQLVELPPRTLIMNVSPDSPINDDTRIFVTLTCAQAIKDPPQTIRIPIKRKIENLKMNNSNSGCSYYWLDINGRASENSDDFNVALDSISLR